MWCEGAVEYFIRPRQVRAGGIGQEESGALLDAIATVAIMPLLWEFNPQGLANTAWAFATARTGTARCDRHGGDAAAVRLQPARARQHMAWGAFAKAEHAAPVLLDAIAAAAH